METKTAETASSPPVSTETAVAATPISGLAEQASPSPPAPEIKPDTAALPVGYESAQAGAAPTPATSTATPGQEPGSLTNAVVHQAEPAPGGTGSATDATSVTNQPSADAVSAGISTNRSTETPTSPPAVAAAVPQPEIKPEVKTTTDVKLPTGFALTAEGETWQDVARRVLGDEKFADQLWKENRDRHDGGFEARPLANHLIRVPKIDGRGSTASQIASKTP